MVRFFVHSLIFSQHKTMHRRYNAELARQKGLSPDVMNAVVDALEEEDREKRKAVEERKKKRAEITKERKRKAVKKRKRVEKRVEKRRAEDKREREVKRRKIEKTHEKQRVMREEEELAKRLAEPLSGVITGKQLREHSGDLQVYGMLFKRMSRSWKLIHNDLRRLEEAFLRETCPGYNFTQPFMYSVKLSET